MKILIAEDDIISSKILQKNLLNWGYYVVPARSGAEAWQALQDEDLRMALLDWMMPGMDGIEVCRKIRRRKKFKYTYIILLSAKDRKQDIITGLSSGADDYMTKPVNFLELRARLQTGRRIIELDPYSINSCFDDPLSINNGIGLHQIGCLISIIPFR